MPFGARLVGVSRAEFRLWAPKATRVDLVLEHGDDECLLPLPAQDGWFRLETDAAPGARYRFRIDGDLRVPDPASRFQPDDVHGASELIDPQAFAWRDGDWRGRPWEECVFYEAHVGTFTPTGTFAALAERLDYLVDLGVTALELMPLSDFPGARNWGYDGVLPYAPDSRYGRPDDLKALIDSAHAKGLMVFLDVVYNHFGPEGNYLHAYAPAFFSDRHHTPWGAAINYDGPGSRTVRDFMIHNALYWLEEYHFDGLRLDAVHAIIDESVPDILTELAAAVRRGPGAQRHVHLVLENDDNAARYLHRDSAGRARDFDAQWNDDIHHAFHVLASGETGGYYADYTDARAHLGRCLTEGFAYQGESSAYRDGEKRGEPSSHLPATAFVAFMQNHDQIGNRAFGERLHQLAQAAPVRALTAILLLSPSPPLLFMGQEWAADQPFPFFCDFGPELARAVTEGRRKEFARFPEFNDPAARERIPDPNAADTYMRAILDFDARENARHGSWLELHRALLALRRREIIPRLANIGGGDARYALIGDSGLATHWRLGDGSTLSLMANLGDGIQPIMGRPSGRLLYTSRPGVEESSELPSWTVLFYLDAEVRA
jgi:malto-oligosyltrehalose trehalohydrolase